MGPRATAQHAHALRQHWSSIENHFTHKIILCKNIPFQDWAKHILNSCTEAVNPDSAPEYHQTSGNRQLNSVSFYGQCGHFSMISHIARMILVRK